MYSAILGFHLLVWCPKCTPASSNCFIEITAMINSSFCFKPPVLSAPHTKPNSCAISINAGSNQPTITDQKPCVFQQRQSLYQNPEQHASRKLRKISFCFLFCRALQHAFAIGSLTVRERKIRRRSHKINIFLSNFCFWHCVILRDVV